MENWRVTFSEPNKVELVKHAIPQVGTAEVLIETECSLISSGTEIICLRGAFAKESHWGQWIGSYPWYPGYQNVGIVKAVGAAVAHVQIGDRVATHSSHSQYVTAPARRCIKVPTGLSSEKAAWFALSAVVQIALLKVNLAQVRRAAVVGVGPVGQLAVRWLRALGVRDVTVTGRSPWRVQLAEAGGGAQNRLEHSIRYAELTLDATGNAEALAEAFRITANNGTVILVGDAPDPVEQRLTSDLLLRGLTLIGAHFGHASMDERSADPARPLTHAQLAAVFFQYLTEKKLDVGPLITHRLPAAEARLAYALAGAREPGTMGILFEWNI